MIKSHSINVENLYTIIQRPKLEHRKSFIFKGLRLNQIVYNVSMKIKRVKKITKFTLKKQSNNFN